MNVRSKKILSISIISLIITIMLVVGITVSPKTYAVSETTSTITGDGKFQYYLTNMNIDNEKNVIYAEAVIERYRLSENTEPVEIPNEIEGYPVTTIGSGAFTNCLTSEIIIPNNVKYINTGAFDNCSNITNINITSNVEKIEPKAFGECNKLENVYIDANNTYFSNRNQDGIIYNKQGNKLIYYPQGKTETSFTIPDGVVEIENYAFIGHGNLKELIIPKGVTYIGKLAFSQCYSLTNINVDKSNNSFSYNDGVLYNKDKTEIICYPSNNKETSFTIPNTVKVIDSRAFENCKNLREIIIPNSVTTIKNSAFAGCSNLEQITIPESVTKIESYAFSGCSKLKNVILPKDLTNIEDGLFADCTSLTEIIIPENVTNIGNYAFSGCTTLKNVIIPNKVVKIGNYAFEECSNFSEIIIPASVTNIGDYAFSKCTNLTKIIIPSNVTHIGIEAFNGDANLKIVTKSNTTAYTYATNKGINIELDNAMPELTISYSTTETTNKNIEVTITANEPIIVVESSKTWNYAENANKKVIKSTYEANVTEIVKVKDLVGNEQTITVKIQNIDKQAPTATVAIDKETYKAGETATITVTFSENVKDGTPKISMSGVTILEETQMTKVNEKTYTYKSRIPNNAGKQTITITGACDIAGNIMNANTSKTLTIIPTINNIKIETPPDRIAYLQGENFDSTGLKVIATYNNGTTKEITEYEIIDAKNLSMNKKSITISYTENEITKTIQQPIIVVEKMLTNIEITSRPSKTSYIEEQNFDTTGLIVTAKYSDNSSKNITNYSIANGENLTTNITQVSIIYTENTITKTVEQPINVAKKILTKIEIANQPSKTSYIEEQEFDATGMEITATYNNGKTATINNYTITNGKNLTANQTTVTLSYTEDEVTKTVEQPITVTKKVLTKIEIVKQPTKTSYIEEQDFDTTGMEITATYNNGKTETINNYTITNGTNLTKEQTTVIISYTANDITKTCTQNITVAKKELQSIKVSKTPTKTTYTKGENFNATGMEITATYNNEKTKKIENYQIYDATDLQVGNAVITIIYTEDGITKNTTLNITVTEKLEISLKTYNEVKKETVTYITNINTNTTAKELVNQITTNGTVKIYKANQQIDANETKLATGMKITISLNNESQEFIIVVKGDTNGDGQSDLKDLLQINKHRLNKTQLTSEYLLAGDVNGDDKVDLKDLLQVNKFRRGKINSL